MIHLASLQSQPAVICFVLVDFEKCVPTYGRMGNMCE